MPSLLRGSIKTINNILLFHFRAMDLISIKRNIEAGVIRNTADYLRDVMLMFFNARMYNKTNDVVYEQAVAMQSDSLEHIEVSNLKLS